MALKSYFNDGLLGTKEGSSGQGTNFFLPVYVSIFLTIVFHVLQISFDGLKIFNPSMTENCDHKNM